MGEFFTETYALKDSAIELFEVSDIKHKHPPAIADGGVYS